MLRNLLGICTMLLYTISVTGQEAMASTESINWITWEEAMEKSKVEPKKIFIDMYTDWCGWCKKLDQSTFKDADVISYINNNFYAIKFDAEQKEPIVYKDHTFTFVPNGRRGYHQLAQSLLNGRMGYPSMVFLDEDMSRIMISPGFKKAKDLLIELEFAKDEIYTKMNFETYKASKA